MKLNWNNNPIKYKEDIDKFIVKMKNKNDYLESYAHQPTIKSIKTPGDKLFDISSILKVDKYNLDISFVDVILQGKHLSEQERKYYNLQKFLYETAQNEYKDVSNILEKYNENINHLQDLLADNQKLIDEGKETLQLKVVLVIPSTLNEMKKSNFWLSLLFRELIEDRIKIEYIINKSEIIDDTNRSVYFKNHANEKYIMVMTDDVSYSGNQISDYTFGVSSNQIFSKPNIIFFNLIGYSEVAYERIIYRQTKSPNKCELIFGRGSKNPLVKLSARFDKTTPQKNNILFLKSIQDFPSISDKFKDCVRMMASLLLNDVFYLQNSKTEVSYHSNIFDYFSEYESWTNTVRRNGSIQYLPIKYPDSWSTINRMCITKRLANVAIIRIDRLIHYMDSKKTNNENIFILADSIIRNTYTDNTLTDKHLWNDNGYNVSIDSNLINLNKTFKTNIDKKIIKIITEPTKLLNIFNKKIDNVNYNNLILNKYVYLNNKISKFNKKHLIEFVMPKNTHQTILTTNLTIKNCTNQTTQINLINNIINSYNEYFSIDCNMCTLNFYKTINWN